MRQPLALLCALLFSSAVAAACGPNASVRDTPDDEPAATETASPEIDRDTVTVFMKQWVNSNAVYEPEYPEVAKPPYDMERPYAPAVVVAQVVDGELKVERLAATPAAQWVNRNSAVDGFDIEAPVCRRNLCSFFDYAVLAFARVGERWLVSGVLAPPRAPRHTPETLAAFRAAVAASDPTAAPAEDE